MRRKILIFVFLSIVITVILSCTILAFFTMRNSLDYAQVQQDYQVQSTISAIGIGLSQGLIPFIDTTFLNVSANQGFVGGIVFDTDMDEIRTFPAGFVFPAELDDKFDIESFDTEGTQSKNIQIKDAAYTLATLVDEDSEVIG